MDRGIRLLREGTLVFDSDQLPALAAGTPILADESKAILRVPEEVARHIHPRADFDVVVHGDSMNLVGYRSGDIVAVTRNPKPRAGDVVITRIGTEITVKCFHRVNEARIELQPRSTNAEHQPILTDEQTRGLGNGWGRGGCHDRTTMIGGETADSHGHAWRTRPEWA